MNRRGHQISPVIADTSDLSSNIEAEQHHVAVLHDVLLALGSHDALFARALPSVVLHEIIIAHRLGADEPALEIGVDYARRHRRRVAAMDRPRANFLFSGGEVRL